MRVTEKGQVTIPLTFRRRLGIVAGTEVEFAMKGEEVVLRRAEPDRDVHEREVAEFMAHIRGFSGSMDTGGLSSDDFMSLLRD